MITVELLVSRTILPDNQKDMLLKLAELIAFCPHGDHLCCYEFDTSLSMPPGLHPVHQHIPVFNLLLGSVFALLACRARHLKRSR